MTELETPTVELPTSSSTAPHDEERPPPPGDGDERGGSSTVGNPFFADVVRAHWEWERRLNDKQADASQLAELYADYQTKLERFASSEGDLVEAYWCTRKASAVALTQRRSFRERIAGDQEMRIHRVSNWLMPRSGQKLVDLLHRCDELADRASAILHGTPKRLALRTAYEVEASVLGFLERTKGKPTAEETDEFVADARGCLDRAQKRYEIAADKVARMIYVFGMLGGVVALVPVAALAGLAIWVFGALHLHGSGTRAFYACMAAGAFGALVSVLSRMPSREKFDLDPDIGRRALVVLGFYRPLVGSIFGVALYFLLQSSVLQVKAGDEFATFVVAAFLGGFSERFVKVMLHSAEDSVGGTSDAGKSGADPPSH